MDQRPTVIVEMTFLRADEGGRVQVPGPPFKDFAPHLVVQDPNVRRAVVYVTRSGKRRGQEPVARKAYRHRACRTTFRVKPSVSEPNGLGISAQMPDRLVQ